MISSDSRNKKVNAAHTTPLLAPLYPRSVCGHRASVGRCALLDELHPHLAFVTHVFLGKMHGAPTRTKRSSRFRTWRDREMCNINTSTYIYYT